MDKLQIVIIVLVVLSQLFGFLVSAWKKRQAEIRKQEEKLGLRRPEESGEPVAAAPAPSSPQSYFPETWENQEPEWDERESEEAPRQTAKRLPPPPPLPTTPLPPKVTVTTTKLETAGSSDYQWHATGNDASSEAGRRKALPSPLSTQVLSRQNLRQAMLAHVVLSKPVALRRTKPSYRNSGLGSGD